MADVLLSVAAAISMGAVLIAPTHSVGPCRVAVGDEALWACFDRHGAPVVAVEEWTEMDPYFTLAGKPFPLLSGKRTESRQDWSAFAAARCFIAAVGEDAAQAALARAKCSPTEEEAPEPSAGSGLISPSDLGDAHVTQRAGVAEPDGAGQPNLASVSGGAKTVATPGRPAGDRTGRASSVPVVKQWAARESGERTAFFQVPGARHVTVKVEPLFEEQNAEALALAHDIAAFVARRQGEGK